MTSGLCAMFPSGPEITLRELSYRLEQQSISVIVTPAGQYVFTMHRTAIDALVAEINDDLCLMHGGQLRSAEDRLHVTLRPRHHINPPDAGAVNALSSLPGTLTPDQQEMLTTVHVLAGLVVHAIRHVAARTDERERAARAILLVWRDFL